ncbi:MAG: SIS domain-containing protein [Gammaproteobacteria bacterium]|nr:SIS domain-containing protein [Gammaproteobacteria bacterium]
MINEYFQTGLDAIKHVDLSKVEKCVECIESARLNGQQVFTFGNGGSASLASHFVNDLVKGANNPDREPFRAMCLNDNIPIVTAYANDYSYNDIYVKQLESLLFPGDLVIPISTSGNSPNVVCAAKFAKAQGAYVFSWTGMDGGFLTKVSHDWILVKSYETSNIEDVHTMIMHSIIESLKAKLK